MPEHSIRKMDPDMIMIALIEQLRATLLPREKAGLILLVFLSFLAALLELLGIGMIMPIIALFISPELFHQNAILIFIRNAAGDLPFRPFLLLLCASVILIFLVKNLLLYFITYYQILFSYSLTARIGIYLTKKYIGTHYEFSLKASTGSLAGKIHQSRNMADFINSIGMLCSESMLILLIVISIFILTPETAIFLTSAGIIFSVLIFLGIRRLLSNLSVIQLEKVSRLNSFIIFSMEALREIKLADRKQYFLNQNVILQEETVEPDRKLFTYSQIPRFIIEAGTVTAGMGIIIILLLMGVAPSSIALKVSFAGIALLRLMPSASRIHYYLARARGNFPLFQRISSELRDVLQEKQDETLPPIEFKKEIVFENISFSYDEKKVFSGLSFRIPKNSSMALKGPTGCGKSTFLDIAAGLLPPTSGRVLADGRDIRENIFSWRRKIGYVPQSVVLAETTVLENVALGVPKDQIDRERVRECLRIAQAETFVDALPDGIDSVIQERGKNLSGGQRQRIGIARALYPNPEILLFDEATSALDMETEAAFVSALENLNGKYTMLIAAHRLSTIERCDQIFDFKGGNSKP